MDTILALDKHLSKLTYIRNKKPINYQLERLCKNVETVLDGHLTFPGSLILYIVTSALLSRKLGHFFLNLFLLQLLDIGVQLVMKLSVRRKRPSYNLNDTSFKVVNGDQYSFPSGHCSRIFAIKTYLSSYGFAQNNIISTVLTLLCLFVAYSRVALGRHYYLDVLAGIFIGVLEGSFYILISNYISSI